MQKSVISKILQGLIWIGFGVVLFSPLYINAAFFFPFIVTKTFAFMIAIEIMFVLYLVLCLIDPKYKLKLNIVLLLLAIYIVILTLASALGGDLFRGFWSNNERSDGILLLGHLFVFVLILTSFLRKVKEWLYFFDLFLIASFCVALVALDQYLSLTFPGFWVEHFLASSNGARLAATIGNAGYVAGYVVFGIFISILMLFKRKNIWLKVAYGALFILNLFIAIQTQTRGAWLALGIFIPIFILYLTFFYFSDLKGRFLNGKNLKIVGIIVIILGIVGVSLIFTNKNTAFVKSNPILNRLASISVSEGNNRLVTWGIAWEGFKERPILGYGQENFYRVFDKYYTTKNTEEWFDRSHNMIGDRAITGGILGLLSYLALLLVPFYFLWKFYKNSDKNETKDSSIDDKKQTWGKKYFLPMIFTILILAYIIQNLFIFEALVTYVPLMFCLAFVGMFGPHFDFKFLENKKFKTVILILFVILLLPALYAFNIKPMNANKDFIKVMASPNLKFDKAMLAYDQVLDMNTYGNQEYLRYYVNYYLSGLNQWMNSEELQKQIPSNEMAKITNKAESYLETQLRNNSESVSNYLMAINFYISAAAFDSSRLEKALVSFEQAKKLSPGRPQVYYSGANIYLNLANYYSNLKQPEKVVEANRMIANLVYQGALKNVDTEKQLTEFSYLLNSLSPELKSLIKKDGFDGKTLNAVFNEFKDKIDQSNLEEAVKKSLLKSLEEAFDSVKNSE